MKYYIIAGEASGDLHGSNLISEIKKLDHTSVFRGFGGDKMGSEGLDIVKHIRELAFMGFTQVLLNLKIILNNIKLCKKDILDFCPDALILIDYPGFNLRIAQFAKKNNIRVIYYISPQIWAWKQSRVHHINKIVDKMICILPFEKDFYKKFGYEVDYVGHPLLDAVKDVRSDIIFEKPVLALLPGSRVQEINTMLPIMLKAVLPLKENYSVIVAGAPGIEMEFYKKFPNLGNARIIKGNTYGILKSAHAALVTSGTATLETALFGVPQLVCYRANKLSYLIAKKLIRVKYISLVNLIMEKQVIREMIQKDMNPETLYFELKKILDDAGRRNKVMEEYKELYGKLGGPGASARAAKVIFDLISH